MYTQIMYRKDYPDGTAHVGTANLVSTYIQHNILSQNQQQFFTIYKYVNQIKSCSNYNIISLLTL